MTILRRTITATATGLLLIGLAACSSGTEGDGPDHDAHDATGRGADATGEHAMGGHEAAGASDLKKITPSADYPLTTCVVSGEPLDAMGGALAYEYMGQEVQFCCQGCLDDFAASPDEYLAKVAAARGR